MIDLPRPFEYPVSPHVRVHGPQGYKNFPDYKPWLRDEFSFRCVYCLEREIWYPSRTAGFAVDHFVPKAVHHEGLCAYDNLVYACNRCNSYKQTKLSLLDPTATAFVDHFAVADDGHIQGLTPEAQDMIDLLDLDDSPALDVRREMLLTLQLKREQPDNPTVHKLFIARFGYPTDLPDLCHKEPPNGNTRPDGIRTCHYEKRDKRLLPDFY